MPRPTLDPAQRAFRPLYGLPCWCAEQGYGSFLTLDFGKPYLFVLEPRKPRRAFGAQRPSIGEIRHAAARGPWHLWIYICHWTVFQDEEPLAHDSSSRRRILRAMNRVSGQALASVQIEAKRRRTQFRFDLGARIETRSYDADSEQWMLRMPRDWWIAVTSDLRYSLHRGNESYKAHVWKDLPRSSLA